jgi:1-acyl-sn-glycerol-3-phosphate acyltransferase
MQLSTLYTYSEFGVLSAAWLPAMAVARGVTAADPTHRVPGRMLRGLARTVTRASRLWHVTVEGALPSDARRRPYVVVSNHASTADPFLLSFLPLDMRFVAKAELFRAPLVGWLLRLAGDIPVRRGDGASAAEMKAACVRTLARGLSVMIFPEGTRSRTGAVGAFKSGAFEVAHEAGAPILPVALHGTGACIDGAEPRAAHAVAEVLAPIDPTGTVADARHAAHDAIAAAVERRRPRVRADYFLDGPVPANRG